MIDDVESVAAADVAPVLVQNARGSGAAWPAPRPIVLQTALDVIKGPSIVGVNLIKLRDGEIENGFPGFGAVVGYRNASVLADPDPAGIFWVHPDRMIVAVNSAGDSPPVTARIDAGHQLHADRINTILVGRIDGDVAIVKSAADHGGILGHHMKVVAAIV